MSATHTGTRPSPGTRRRPPAIATPLPSGREASTLTTRVGALPQIVPGAAPVPAAQALLDVPADPCALAAARHFTAAALAAWGLSALTDRVVLYVSETVTNALLHTDTALIRILLLRQGEQVRVEVEDHGPHQLPPVAAAADDDEHHRGLALASALADEHGATPTPAGKCLWALFTAPAA